MPRYVCAERLSAASVTAYLYAITATFYATRALFRPRETLRELWRTATSPRDSGLLGRILRGAVESARRALSDGFAAERVTWPPIDWAKLARERGRERAPLNLAGDLRGGVREHHLSLLR